jgi:CBS domain containing-hemolysin-like protein
MLLLFVIVVTSLSISFLCSILEASLLSSSIVSLSERKERGDKGATLLLDLKENRLDDSISAILTYNTIAHTVGAALSGAQAAVVFGDTWVGVFSGVLTLLILVFTEIIPKTIGTVYASSLAGFVGKVISLMIKPPMKWILYATRTLTKFIAKEKPQPTTRGDVVTMLKMATQDGALAREESKILANFLQFDKIMVADVMTPRTVAAMFDETKTLKEILHTAESRVFSRLPLYRETRDNIKGYVLMRELLRAAFEEQKWDEPVSSLKRPVLIVSAELPVGKALKQFTQQSEHLAMVVDEVGVCNGLVTMEDLIETALGVEIVDEFDQVADLRKVALELREKRLAQMQTLRTENTTPQPTSNHKT